MKRRGISIVEYVAVIMLVVLAATIMIPRLVAMQNSQQAVSFRLGLTNLALGARTYAMEKKVATTLKFDDQGRLGWSPVQDETNSDGTTITSDEAQTRSDRRSIPVPSTVQFNSFQRFGQDSNQTDWHCDFYPDGSADDSALGFNQDGIDYAYTVDPERAFTKLVQGQLQDRATTKWDAGEIERRA